MWRDNLNSAEIKEQNEGAITNLSLRSVPALSKEQTITTILPDRQQLIASHFSTQYEMVFTKQESLSVRLKELIALSHQIQKNIEQLIEERLQEQKWLVLQKQLITLLDAVNVNETHILGRAYFLELIKQHEVLFHVLLEQATVEQKEALISIKTALETDENKWLRLTSTAFAPLIALSRLSLSNQTQEMLNQRLPQTLDAQAKQLIKKVARDVLDKLEIKIQQAQEIKNKILIELSFKNPVLERLIRGESSESLKQLALLNTLSSDYEDLESFLIEQPKSTRMVKMHVQELVQHHYFQVMEAYSEEREKIDALIMAMKETTQLFDFLIELSEKKDNVLLQLLPMTALANVFNCHTTNEFIGLAIKETLLMRNEEYDLLESAIEKQAFLCARGDSRLQDCLLQSTTEHLRELRQTHHVDKITEELLLNSATVFTLDPIRSEEENALQEYFNHRYIELVNQDRFEEKERLTFLLHYMEYVETQLIRIEAIRQEADQIALKIFQISEVIRLLQQQESNTLLINLITRRLDDLKRQAIQTDVKLEELVNTFALEDSSFKNLLLQQSYKAFHLVIKEHQAVKDCLKEYNILKDKIIILIDLRKTNGLLADFIAKQESWWVKLTNFLAQFLSIFQTEVGDRVKKANALMTEIKNSSETCEQEILSHMEHIKQSHLGNELLGDLPLQHDYSKRLDTIPFEVDHALSLLTQASLFKPQAKLTTSQGLDEVDENECETMDYGCS